MPRRRVNSDVRRLERHVPAVVNLFYRGLAATSVRTPQGPAVAVLNGNRDGKRAPGGGQEGSGGGAGRMGRRAALMTDPGHAGTERRGSLLAGLLFAAAFLALSSPHLEEQGLYYDELHQAPAAFNYLGGDFAGFNYNVRGVPILNMTYSGAIKSNVYGLYLKVVPTFTVRSWRLLGLLFVAAGLVAFFLIAGPSLPPAARILFGLLLVTDTTVVLTVRHDWGPVALALALRLLLLALCVSTLTGRALALKCSLAGCVAGIALFEKLSSVCAAGPVGGPAPLAAQRAPVACRRGRTSRRVRSAAGHQRRLVDGGKGVDSALGDRRLFALA